MKTYKVPAREDVSSANQVLFDKLKTGIGMVPNLYASMASSENGLSTYLGLTQAKTSLSATEKEVINLVVSQVNSCDYCLSAHTAIGKLNGFTEEQIIEIRKGGASFNPKYDALAKYVKSAAENKGHASEEALDNFFAAGFTYGNLVDTINVIGDKTITNYLYAALQVPIDFPVVHA
jgi:AhpD family alkylhydroperoxidase